MAKHERGGNTGVGGFDTVRGRFTWGMLFILLAAVLFFATVVNGLPMVRKAIFGFPAAVYTAVLEWSGGQ